MCRARKRLTLVFCWTAILSVCYSSRTLDLTSKKICFSSVKSMAKVFAGMSDGLVAVYSLVEDLPLDGETYLCSHTLNKTVFGLKDSDPRQRPYPVRTIALVSSGSLVRRTVRNALMLYLAS